MKELGVNTHTSGLCASSCTMLYAAGVRRSAGSGAQFMFHAVNVKLASGLSKAQKAEFKPKIDAYIHEFSNKWLETIRGADSYLAWELEKDRILLKGKDRFYSARTLRRTGYVNQ